MVDSSTTDVLLVVDPVVLGLVMNLVVPYRAVLVATAVDFPLSVLGCAVLTAYHQLQQGKNTFSQLHFVLVCFICVHLRQD